MRTCGRCGTQNPDERDFCQQCGEYLRWDPTQYIQAAPDPTAPEVANGAGDADLAMADAEGAEPAAQGQPTEPDPTAGGDGTAEIDPVPTAGDAPAVGTEASATGASRFSPYPGPPPPSPTSSPASTPTPAPTPPPAPAGAPVGSGNGVSEAPVPVAVADPGGGPGDGTAEDGAPEAVLLALRLPQVEVATPGEVRTSCEAGSQTALRALVRNQSGIVDNYDLTIEGLPAGWARVEPSTVYLVPFGAPNGTYEEDVLILLTPPRSPAALARDWPVQLVARSRAHDMELARAGATLTIEPFLALESELRPTRAAGRRRARYALAVRNQANAPAEIELKGLDDEEALRFDFHQPRIAAGPGRRAGSAFAVRPRKQIWIGRPVDHRFEVTPRALAAPAPELPVQGLMRQKAWLPLWLLFAIPLIAGAVAAAIALWPEDSAALVTVPDLSTAADMLEVQALLDAEGLTLGERFPTPTEEAAAGAVVGQEPPPGDEVEPGSAVAINVAAATGAPDIEVPSLIGLTLRQANRQLSDRGLQIGRQLTEPTGRTAKIGFQAPEPGELAREGDPVDIDFRAPPAAAPSAVPAVAALPVAAAVEALVEAEVPYVIEMRLSADVPAGELIEQIPPEGAEVPEGERLRLVVSAGNPLIAFDDGKDVLTMGAAGGKPLAQVASSPAVEGQPAFGATGLIAYRRASGGANPRLPGAPAQIWIVNPADGLADPITDEGFDDRRPAFGPDGQVLALVSNRPEAAGRDFNLCFQRLDTDTLVPACISSPDLSVSRPAWSPDGKAILLASERLGADRSELVMYTSRRASSARPGDWTLRNAVPPRFHASRAGDQVRSVAWSPDGRRVAFAANWGGGVFRLFVAPVRAGNRLGRPRAVGRASACEVSFGQAGLGQLVISQRDPVTCEGPGQVLRLDPGDPSRPVVLSRIGAGNPSWSPVSP